ncbi:hypothetical protein D0T49_03740, partial [Paludibacter sp. 221]|uniref:fibrobacter succinogenes major paralogous domain-containing protein n=1 Tax=Paludibacter sp. 221 TaxID=2302939 RepID=UPI001D47D6B0
RQTLVLFCLFQFSFFIFSATAQVTIGADKAPETFSALEVVSTTGGLRLPQLTTVQRNNLSVSGKGLAKGLIIYNADIDCTETWNGTLWIANCGDLQNALRITTQPRKFNWAETKNATALTGIGGESATISVAATGIAPLTYQWYELTANSNAAPVTVTDGADEATAAFTPNLSKLGMRRYYCRITDGDGNTIDSEIAEVAVGCGAKTVTGGWSTFMCHNLGADENKSIEEQKTYSSPVFSYPNTRNDNSVVYGDLYQWGRTRDGHEKRTSGVSDVIVTDVATGSTTANGVTMDGLNTFIKATSYPYNWTSAATADLNWRNQKNATYDPCPTGWRVPAQGEWSGIFRGGSAPGTFSTAVVNTWVWNDDAGSTTGYEVKPDGETTTLFLPAAGYRYNFDGEFYNVGTKGYYWSGGIYGCTSFALYFNGSTVSPATIEHRAYGRSVRCIAEF